LSPGSTESLSFPNTELSEHEVIGCILSLASA
jgi:hypothetical protein